jgi:hypothetical protein
MASGKTGKISSVFSSDSSLFLKISAMSIIYFSL